MRLRYALLVCAGCDAVFGLHDVPPIDATHGAGSDAAGTACPAHPHAIVIDGSGDLDHDGLDNCHDPLPRLRRGARRLQRWQSRPGPALEERVERRPAMAMVEPGLP